MDRSIAATSTMRKPDVLETMRWAARVRVHAVLSLMVFIAVCPLTDSPSASAAETLATERRLDEEICRQIDDEINQALSVGEMAGAVVVVADRSRLLFAQAYGDRQVEPARVPMTLDTVFDMASITKPVATATSVMKLQEQGKVELDALVCEYLPEFVGSGKEEIRVIDLLLHQGGLIPDNALADYQQGKEIAWKKICDLSLRHRPGEEFVYTDVGFIVLGKLVERVSGQTLDRFAQTQLFSPAGMSESGFNPAAELRARAAATETRDGEWMVGVVHDPRAHLLEGVAGHAGLFSTAADLVAYGRMMLAGGEFNGVSVLKPETISLMTSPRPVSRGLRALGWDSRSPYSSNRGESFSDAAFGHGGFTGTVFWVDPARELVFVFLSNRLHPDGKGNVNPLAGRVATIVGNAVQEVATRNGRLEQD